MNYIFHLLIIYIIIDFSFGQTENYCDLSHYCNNCTICGSQNGNYCSCNFYNSYCLNEGSSRSRFLNDFILKYDGCLTSNGNMENICGTSDISIESGESKTIRIQSTSQTDFVCYYNIKKSQNNDNKMVITIQKEGTQLPGFDLYLIRYNSNNQSVITTLSDTVLSNNIEIEDSDCQKVSVYFDVENPQNIEKISLNFLNKNEEESTTPTTTTSPVVIPRPSKSSSSNKGLIYGLVIGGIALVIVIILGIVLALKCRNKDNKIIIPNETNNNTINNNTSLPLNNYPEYVKIMNGNKEKMDNLFKTELLPKIYNKNNTTNDCYNCTICMEDYIDNKSVVVTTKCGHTFHQKCFKNWVYKNIICPKCPNCNYLILGPKSDIKLLNISVPTTINDYTIQTNGGNATTFG